MMDLPEYFQKTVIQDFQCIILFVGVPVTNSHGIPIERAVNNFLALPAVAATGLNMVGKFFC